MNHGTLAVLLLVVVAQLAQSYVLEPKRASELFGKRASELFGKRASELFGKRASELFGKRASELFGKRASELFGKRASELFGKRSSQKSLSPMVADQPDAEMISKRAVNDDDYYWGAMTPDAYNEIMDRFETMRGRRASELFGR